MTGQITSNKDIDVTVIAKLCANRISLSLGCMLGMGSRALGARVI